VWLIALLLLLGLTLLVTRPQTATRLAAQAGTRVPNLLLRAGASGDPSATVAAGSGAATDRRASGTGLGRAGTPSGPAAADPGAEAVQRTVAGRYWTAFVAEPLSRLQTGTTVLATAPPEGKAGVLRFLRARVAAVGDWAVGRRGPERAVIATLTLAYVVPFALLLIALAMLASCAQALLWLLLLAAPLVAPLAVDPRRRGAVLRYWLVPLAAALVLLAGSALAALVVIRVAELTHAADAYLGMLLAGSTAPVVAAALAIRRLLHRHPRPSPRQPSRRRQKVVVLRGGAA
jgi:hypothetical protein